MSAVKRLYWYTICALLVPSNEETVDVVTPTNVLARDEVHARTQLIRALPDEQAENPDLVLSVQPLFRA